MRVLRSAALFALVASSLMEGTAGSAVACLGKRATIVGTQGPDRLVGTRRADVIAGFGGADTIRGRGGNDLICGGGKRDAISGGRGSDLVSGGSGADTVFGNAGSDGLATGPGTDFATGGGGDDRISLGGGKFNVASGGPGDDRVSGASILDLLTFANAPQGVNVDIAEGTAEGEGTDTLAGIDAVDGSRFDDTLVGNTSTNFLSGGEGDDRIESRGNGGTLESPDTIFTQRAYDVLSGDLSLFGFGPSQGAGDDTFIGGSGMNVVVYTGASAGVDVDLTTGIASGQGTDSLSEIQMVLGTPFNDSLRGNDQANAFEGEGGRDTIDGRGGQDVAVFLDARKAEVNLTTGTASPLYPSENQGGSATLANLEDIWGSFGRDTLEGGPLANRIFGMDAADAISGSAGDDYLDGGEAADTLDGGLGTDTCVNGEDLTGCEGGSGLEVTDSSQIHRLSRVWSYWFVHPLRNV